MNSGQDRRCRSWKIISDLENGSDVKIIKFENITTRRVLGTFGSLMATRIIRFAEQFITLPVLIHAWGPNLFGEWAALYSLVAITGLANAGLGQASSTDILLAYSKGDLVGARKSFSTSLFISLGLIISACMVVFVLTMFFELNTILQLEHMSSSDQTSMALLFFAIVLSSFLVGPVSGVLCAEKGGAVTPAIWTLSKLLDIMVTIVIAGLGYGPLQVAAGLLINQLLTLVVYFYLALNGANWVWISISDFSAAAAKRYIGPSLGIITVIFCTGALSTYIPRLIILNTLGSTAVTVFLVFVTYTKSIRSISNIVVQSMQVEVGRAYAEKSEQKYQKMVSLGIGGVILLSTALFFIFLLSSNVVIPFWTRGAVASNWILILLFLMGAYLGSVNDSIMSVLMSINKHSHAATVYAFALTVSLLLSYIAIGRMGLTAFAVTFIFAEMISVVYGFVSLRRLNVIKNIKLNSFLLEPLLYIRRTYSNFASFISRP